MFRGITAVQIDVKGRLTIPTRYRAALLENASMVVVTIDTEQPCLLLYPSSRWLEIEVKLEQLPSFHPASRRIQRLLIGHATDIEPDTQGRLLLPPLLREYAGLEKNIILVGQGKKFEIWNEEKWHIGRNTWLAEVTNGSIPSELSLLSL